MHGEDNILNVGISIFYLSFVRLVWKLLIRICSSHSLKQSVGSNPIIITIYVFDTVLTAFNFFFFMAVLHVLFLCVSTSYTYFAAKIRLS